MVIRRNCGFFWVKKAYKLYGIAIFDYFLNNFIGLKVTKVLKKKAADLFPSRLLGVFWVM
jgi:hypothetical protein